MPVMHFQQVLGLRSATLSLLGGSNPVRGLLARHLGRSASLSHRRMQQSTVPAQSHAVLLQPLLQTYTRSASAKCLSLHHIRSERRSTGTSVPPEATSEPEPPSLSDTMQRTARRDIARWVLVSAQCHPSSELTLTPVSLHLSSLSRPLSFARSLSTKFPSVH